jgi:hypothetical protein
MGEEAMNTLLSSGQAEERIAGLHIAVRWLKQVEAAHTTAQVEAQALRCLGLVGAPFVARMLIDAPEKSAQLQLAVNVAQDFLEVACLFPAVVREALPPASPVWQVLLKRGLGLGAGNIDGQAAVACTRAQTLLRLAAKSDGGGGGGGLALFLLEGCLAHAPTRPEHATFLLHMTLEVTSSSSCRALQLSSTAASCLRDVVVGSLHLGGRGAGATMGLNTGTADDAHDTALLALEAALRGLAPAWTMPASEGGGAHASVGREGSGGSGGSGDSGGSGGSMSTGADKKDDMASKPGAFVVFLYTTAQLELEVLSADAADALAGSATADDTQLQEEEEQQQQAGKKNKKKTPNAKNTDLARLEMLWGTVLGMLDNFLALMLDDAEDEDEGEDAGGPWTALPGPVLLGLQRSLYSSLDCCIALRTALNSRGATAPPATVAAVRAMLRRAQQFFEKLAEDDPSVAERTASLCC